jgi:hypothetical protein
VRAWSVVTLETLVSRKKSSHSWIVCSAVMSLPRRTKFIRSRPVDLLCLGDVLAATRQSITLYGFAHNTLTDTARYHFCHPLLLLLLQVNLCRLNILYLSIRSVLIIIIQHARRSKSSCYPIPTIYWTPLFPGKPLHRFSASSTIPNTPSPGGTPFKNRAEESRLYTNNISQVCHLHIGQAGTQLGNAAWEL